MSTTAPAPTTTAHARKPQPLKWRILTILPPIMLTLGVLVLLYPVLATQHNNAEQQRIADAYSAEMTNVGPDALAAELDSADHYNTTLAESPILDPWLESQRPDTPQYQEYLHQLDLNPVMGQVVIPKIHVDLPIYHGTTDDVLGHGIGHLFGTALPIGGPSTHSVLTGHTGLGTATLFDNLVDLTIGDVFYLQVSGRYLKYEVNDIRVVLPNETETLNKVIGRDLVTLITCTPYGVNSHRLLITGERVAIDPVAAAAETEAATPAPLQTWMIWVLVAVGVIVLIAVVLAIRWFLAGRKRRRDEARADSDRAAVLEAAATRPLPAPSSVENPGSSDPAAPSAPNMTQTGPLATDPRTDPPAPDATRADAPRPDAGLLIPPPALPQSSRSARAHTPRHAAPRTGRRGIRRRRNPGTGTDGDKQN
ncbi:class C sortase [Actinomyces sp. B33]|uniref:class C sortase n=1 Tax=Actinomyces sp. B33 TaxID=2942131 RepID=UPI002340D8BF|nr:class C sortase [Actinomyces sp. B33]MDC4233910.1 class C sortase [Actinomyces sp. B33]